MICYAIDWWDWLVLQEKYRDFHLEIGHGKQEMLSKGCPQDKHVIVPVICEMVNVIHTRSWARL